MKLKNKKLAIHLSLILIVIAVACVLRTTALTVDFNFYTGYFAGKGLITAANSLVLAGVLSSVLYMIFAKTRADLAPDFHGVPTYITSGLLALSFIFTVFDVITGNGFFAPYKATSIKLLSVLVILSALASVIYLFLNVFLGKRYSTARGTFALAPIIFFIAYASSLYFDTSTPINAPNKSIDLLACVSVMLFFTQEARLSLGREKWRPYVTLGVIGAIMTAYSAVPTLIVYFIKMAEGGRAISVSSGVTASVLLLSAFVFTAARVTSVAFLKTNEKGKLASLISKRAEEKGEEEEEEEEVISNENQMSIDDIMNVQESESESDK